jgi:hypothetical protein
MKSTHGPYGTVPTGLYGDARFIFPREIVPSFDGGLMASFCKWGPACQAPFS